MTTPTSTTPLPPLKLVTRADDIGSSRAANRAGIDVVEKGIIRNVSMMIPAPAFEDAAQHYINRKTIALGLHVTLNCEWDLVKWGPVLPAAKVPSLVDERGHFLKTPMDNHARGLDVEQALAEIKAQLDLARKHGLNIEYMDEHMGIGWVNQLHVPLAQFARREGLMDTRSIPGLPAAVQEGDILAQWAGSIQAAPGGTYVLLCHPCRDDEESRLMSPKIAAERDIERQTMMDPQLRQACEKRGAKIIKYTDVRS